MDIEILLLVILLALSGLFSGSETALVSISLAKVKNLVKEKRRGAATLLLLKKDPKTLLTTILIGNNLVNIGAAALTTAIMIDKFGSKGIGIATGLLTLIILIFGEITPKNLAHAYNVRFALLMAGPIYLLNKLFYPVIYVLNILTFLIIKMVGGTQSPLVTEEELKTMVAMGVEEGEVDKKEKEMIDKVFEFNDIKAEEVMTPRTGMFCLDESLTLKEALKTLARIPYSRIPLIKGSKDNVVGILYVKDILKYLEKGRLNIKLIDLARETYFIPEDIILNQLFKQFQDKKIHMAVIVDEHGGVAGLVTLEDILEELVGEILDETDISPKGIKIIDKNNILVDGTTELKEINNIFSIKLPGKDTDTISKVVLNKLKRIPKKGDELKLDRKILVRIEDSTSKKISKVRITNLNKSSTTKTKS